mmetsp:Transcript_9985/g.16398  ORF Transcript_9985/g.16398 Transcript_9985/m.16398 type:complete len:201 (-) Transcript_9985:483-1085(-)
MSVMFTFHLNLVSFLVLLMFMSMKFLEANTPTYSTNLANLALPTSGLRSNASMLKLIWSWVTFPRLLHLVRLSVTSPNSWWHKTSILSKWKIRLKHLPSLNLSWNSCAEKLVFHRVDFRSLFALRYLNLVVLRVLMDAQEPVFLITTSKKQRSFLRRSLVLNSLMTRMSCLMLSTPMYSLSGRSLSLSMAKFPSSQLIFS